MTPAWAKGYPVDRLAAVSSLFSAHEAGLLRGAFSRAREVAVVDWLEHGRLTCWANGVGQPVLAVVSRRASTRRAVGDFSGRLLGYEQPGDSIVLRVASAPGWEGALPAAVRSACARPAWAHIWQEHPVQRWLASALGLSWVGSRVRASSELTGSWAAHAAACAPQRAEEEGLAPLDSRYDPGPAADEVDAVVGSWADHYAPYNLGHSWSAVALRGYTDDPSFIIKPTEMSRRWKQNHPELLNSPLRDTELRGALPECDRLSRMIPGRQHRVRLMRVSPGGGLSRHADTTDPDSGIADGRVARIHLALRSHPACRFQSWHPDGSSISAHMDPGRPWYLDTRRPHAAANAGHADRIHLVVDVEAGPELRGLLQQGPEPTQPPRVVPALRSLEGLTRWTP